MANTFRLLFMLFFWSMVTLQALAQWNYTNPPNGSRYRNPQTTILLKSAGRLSNTSLENADLIRVIGSSSGSHPFTLQLSVDRKNIIITPDHIFLNGEEVEVTVGNGFMEENGTALPSLSFSFYTIKSYNNAEREALETAMRRSRCEKEEAHLYGNKTDNTPPAFNMTVAASLAFFGSAFFASKYNLAPEKDKLICILNNDSTFSLSQNVAADGADFKVNKNGYLTYYSPPNNKFYLLDSNYYLLDSFECKNGYAAELDNHEFLMFPDGSKYLLISHKEIVDMSQVVAGGNPNAVVEFPVIQEQDAVGNVIFEWASWDHFNITDATYDVPLTANSIDPFHTNSIEVDYDNNLLISSRYLDEITKIDHENGNIIWRMGGENNQFTFVNDPVNPHFSHQHDVRRLTNGNITLFDNGNLRFPQVSYAREYQLDEVNKIATLIWSYQHPAINGKEVFGLAAGNTQRLSNGNTLVNYGMLSNFNAGLPNATEVTPSGDIAWEIRFTENQTFSYRMFKFDWDPCSRPTDYTLTAVSISPFKEQLTWGTGSGAGKYKVQYRLAGSSSWQFAKPAANSKTIKNLQSSSNYEWRVKSICSGEQSTYTAIHTFQTVHLKNIPEQNFFGSFILFPNPTSQTVILQFKSHSKQKTEYLLINAQGILVDQKELEVQEGANRYEINVESFPAGIYLLSIAINEEVITTRLVVE
ncbi:MAG: aryl-sulfate sulfotransferase [Chitinophagales bacterium]